MSGSSRGRPPHPDVLTPAEWQVVEWVRHGLTNRQIAQRRGTSAEAAKYHVANVLQKLGFSNRRELRQWEGVRRDSGLHRRERVMKDDVKLGALGQVSRSVKDIEAAQSWYRDVLGLPHLYTFGNLAFFDMGGVRLFLTEGDSSRSDSLLYFRVEDVHGAHQALAARGAQFLGAPHLIHRHADGTEEWMAFFNDNEGRPLAIMAQVATA